LVEEVDRFHTRAVDAGGRTVFPPEDTEWGTRRARVLDRRASSGAWAPTSPGSPGRDGGRDLALHLIERDHGEIWLFTIEGVAVV